MTADPTSSDREFLEQIAPCLAKLEEYRARETKTLL
jgi:hypothetical protein